MSTIDNHFNPKRRKLSDSDDQTRDALFLLDRNMYNNGLNSSQDVLISTQDYLGSDGQNSTPNRIQSQCETQNECHSGSDEQIVICTPDLPPIESLIEIFETQSPNSKTEDQFQKLVANPSPTLLRTPSTGGTQVVPETPRFEVKIGPELSQFVANVRHSCGQCLESSNDLKAEYWIQCHSDCQQFFHMSCVGINENIMDLVLKSQTIKWICLRCLRRQSQDRKSLDPLISLI